MAKYQLYRPFGSLEITGVTFQYVNENYEQLWDFIYGFFTNVIHSYFTKAPVSCLLSAGKLLFLLKWSFLLQVYSLILAPLLYQFGAFEFSFNVCLCSDNRYTRNKMVLSELVSTPAINFVILNNTVSLFLWLRTVMYCLCIQVKAYPGEPVHLVIVPFDEQNFIGSDMFEIRGAAVDSVSHQRLAVILYACTQAHPCFSTLHL